MTPLLEGIVVAAESAPSGVLRSEELLALTIDEQGDVEPAGRVGIDRSRHWKGRRARLAAGVEHVTVIETDRELSRVVAYICEQAACIIISLVLKIRMLFNAYPIEVIKLERGSSAGGREMHASS